MIADIELRLAAGTRATNASFGYHLVFIDSDHVLDKSNPHPRIAARILDPDHDRVIVDKLAHDALGPRAIFDDVCWMARGDGAPSCR
jgi:hypothetical protein